MSLGINTKPVERGASRAPLQASVDRPIFITGLGRSGSTIVHTMLAAHPRANWLSLLTARYPKKPHLNKWLMTALDVPVVGALLKRRFVPLENYSFWDAYYRGFGAPCRDLVAGDVDRQTSKAIRTVAGKLVTPTRDRLLIKITGAPRISFLHEIFPDAKFVHMTRDGRDVAASRMKTPFWRGWQGLNASTMPAAYRDEWERHQFSFVALAGIEWKMHCDQLEAIKRTSPAIAIHELRYEAFCADPIGQLKEVARHCELAWDAAFERTLRAQFVRSENGKWKADLTPDQQRILEDVLGSRLAKYGYEPAAGSAVGLEAVPVASYR
jgi:sulfotransferase family protein